MAQGIPSNMLKKLCAIATVGTSIEWYDFYIYGTASALVFPTLFFPASLPPLAALLAAFSTFAVGFIARPIGGIVFGHFGDRLGRKKALVSALVLMGICTSLIGLLPSYEKIGILAPLALIFLRFLQGFAIGGQWGGAILLVIESAPQNRRGFYGSFAQIGVCVGLALANIAFFIASSQLSPEDFVSWGWRLPFVLSIALVLVAIYAHTRLEDTPIFRELQEKQEHKALAPEAKRSPVLEAIRLHPRQIVLAAGAFMALQVAFFIVVTFVVAYGSNPATLAIPRSQMLIAVLIGAIVMLPSVMLSAAFSDRHGRRGIYLTATALLLVWSFVLFPLIETKSFPLIVLGLAIEFVIMGMIHGPHGAFMSELFSTKVRYSGASLGYQSGAILGGGFAPLIATALLAHFGSSIAISVYIALACGITLLSVFLLEETHKNDLHAM